MAVALGITAGLLTYVLNKVAHGLQSLIYGLGGSSLSAAQSVSWQSLLALPIGGLILGFGSREAVRRWRTPVDVVEANALHGGAIPWRDTVLVCVQTLLSNGVGASVGLEAAYAQAGGGFASIVGQWLRLRRADMRYSLIRGGRGHRGGLQRAANGRFLRVRDRYRRLYAGSDCPSRGGGAFSGSDRAPARPRSLYHRPPRREGDHD